MIVFGEDFGVVCNTIGNCRQIGNRDVFVLLKAGKFSEEGLVGLGHKIIPTLFTMNGDYILYLFVKFVIWDSGYVW